MPADLDYKYYVPALFFGHVLRKVRLTVNVEDLKSRLSSARSPNSLLTPLSSLKGTAPDANTKTITQYLVWTITQLPWSVMAVIWAQYIRFQPEECMPGANGDEHIGCCWDEIDRWNRPGIQFHLRFVPGHHVHLSMIESCIQRNDVDLLSIVLRQSHVQYEISRWGITPCIEDAVLDTSDEMVALLMECRVRVDIQKLISQVVKRQLEDMNPGNTGMALAGQQEEEHHPQGTWVGSGIYDALHEARVDLERRLVVVVGKFMRSLGQVPPKRRIGINFPVRHHPWMMLGDFVTVIRLIVDLQPHLLDYEMLYDAVEFKRPGTIWYILQETDLLTRRPDYYTFPMMKSVIGTLISSLRDHPNPQLASCVEAAFRRDLHMDVILELMKNLICKDGCPEVLAKHQRPVPQGKKCYLATLFRVLRGELIPKRPSVETSTSAPSFANEAVAKRNNYAPMCPDVYGRDLPFRKWEFAQRMEELGRLGYPLQHYDVIKGLLQSDIWCSRNSSFVAHKWLDNRWITDLNPRNASGQPLWVEHIHDEHLISTLTSCKSVDFDPAFLPTIIRRLENSSANIRHHVGSLLYNIITFRYGWNESEESEVPEEVSDESGDESGDEDAADSKTAQASLSQPDYLGESSDTVVSSFLDAIKQLQ